MKRILCITPSMNAGGAETFLMKIFRKLDHKEYHFDFCVSSKEPGFYDEEIKRSGSKMYYIHPKTQSFRLFKKELMNVLKTNKYDAVYRCGATGFMAIDLWIAKKCGVKIRVFRSTNAGTTENKLKQIINALFRRVLTSVCNVKIAPSMLAAEYTFGKKIAHNSVYILNNGIDVDIYKFSSNISKQYRNKMKLEERKVFLHIGRFVEQKNHKFLIKVFSEYLHFDNRAVLLLIGEGPLKDDISSLVEENGIKNNVIFLPITNHVEYFLSVADVLLLPSLFEGMPNVVIEAQCSGLPCIVSNNVTQEANVLKLVHYCSLESIDKWIGQMKIIERPDNPEGFSNLLKQAGYDVNDTSKKFIDIVFKNDYV